MIDTWIQGAWPGAVTSAAQRFRQGHVLVWNSVAFAAAFAHSVCSVTSEGDGGGNGYVRVDDAWPYVLITSQTCDICEEGKRRPRMPWVSVVPVYDILPVLRDGQAGLVRQNRIGYLVPLTHQDFQQEGRLWVADLRIEYPLEKGVLVDRDPIEAFAKETDYVYLGDKLAYRRNRPAIDARVRKFIASPFGDWLEKNEAVAANITEVRIRCAPQWDTVEQAQLVILIGDPAMLESTTESIMSWWDQALGAVPDNLAFLVPDIQLYRDFRYEASLAAIPVDYSDLSP
jgi:hypothetical protein